MQRFCNVSNVSKNGAFRLTQIKQGKQFKAQLQVEQLCSMAENML